MYIYMCVCLCLKVVGPLPFGLTGILAGILDVLAENKISVFTIRLVPFWSAYCLQILFYGIHVYHH